MLKRFFALLVLAAGLVPAAEAQAHSPPPQPRRLIQTIGSETPIVLQSLRVSAEISGGLAETTVEMVFFNPNSRQLEGNLQFPLLEGQQITAFALDIDGNLRSAVPVEKAKGRQVFEEIVRRRVDPGLLEKTQGNNFQLRIYPVPANGTRTVQIKYAEPLARQGANWTYRLPLAYGDKLRDFDLKLVVRGSTALPKASGALGELKFTRKDEGFEAAVKESNVAPSGMLNIVLPAAQEPQTYTQAWDGATYFVTEIPISGKRVSRVLPKVIGLLWDSSGSGAGRALDAELAVLDRYFRVVGNGEVRLTRLRDRAEATEVFKIVNGNWSALQAALRATRYDGATALAHWNPQADVGEYLLVSDGLNNYGSTPFPQLVTRQRLYALNSALSADTDRLAALAERTGGRLIQVSPQKPEAAAQALLTEGPHVDSITASGATDLQIETHDPQDGLIRIAGRLLTTPAELQLNISQGNKARVIVPIARRVAPHPNAAQLWAGYRLRSLEADHELQSAEIRRVGQRFGLPTRETSLIVLELMQDYVRYEIEPPAAYRAEYDRLRAERGAQMKQQRAGQLERIVREFKQKITWWEKDYPKGEPPPRHEPKAKSDGMRRGDGASADMMERRSASESAPQMAMRAAPAAPAPVAGAAKAMDGGGRADAGSNEIGITLKKWTSDAPYIRRMQAASPETIYAVYLDEKPSYQNSSAFFLDAADMLFEKKQRDLALRVLSNLAEMQLENRHVLRILGYRLMQAGAPELAIPVLTQVRKLAEEEPQSFRDLGLAYAAAGQHQEAINQLNEVVTRPWDNRFAEIELVALAELNAIVAAAPSSLDTSRIDPRLLKNMPLDVRAVLSWDADNSDMDLWVTDPNGERAYYGHMLTYQGGRMSRDFTGGYGPEEFSLRHAKPGKYKIEASYYGARQQIVTGATTLQLALTTGFGTTGAKTQMITLRLKGSGETIFVGEFEVKPRKP
jgi:tetratricopeptide (TPR) repeat protein